MNIAYYEGAFMPLEEAKVPVTDRGLLFGDGAYATLQVQEGTPCFLDNHLELLEEKCRSFGLLMPPISLSTVEELIRLNRAEEGIWRLKIVVTGGDHPALSLPLRKGRLFMILNRYEPPPFKPLKVGIFPCPFYLCHASYKSLANLNRLYVMEEAQRQGVDDCLTMTEKGVVLEMAFGNLCWILGKTLFTPSRTLPLYFGITLRNMIEEFKSQGYAIQEVESTLEELPVEAEYFRTNTMGGIWPICEITTLFKREQLVHSNASDRFKRPN